MSRFAAMGLVLALLKRQREYPPKSARGCPYEAINCRNT